MQDTDNAPATHVRNASRGAGHALSRRLDLTHILTHLSPETWALLAILAVALVMRMLPLGAYSTEFDEGVYWLSLRAMAAGHPLYTSIYNAQAPFFLASLYPPFLLLGQTLVAARVAIALYSLVGIAATYIIGNAVGGRYVGLAAAALVTADPLFLMQSRTLEAEMPSLALMLLGIALALEAGRRRESHISWLVVASGALLGFALMVKLLAVVGLVPAVLALAWPAQLLPQPLQSRPDVSVGQRGRVPRGRLPQLLWAELRAAAPSLGLFLAGFAGACLLVLLPLLANLGTVYHQAVGVYLGAAHVRGSALQSNLQTMLSLHGEWPLALAAGIAVAFAIWRRSPLVLLVAAWALATFAAVLQQPTPWPHHFVFLVPPFALLVALLVRLSPLQSRPLQSRPLQSRPLQPRFVTYGAGVLLGVTLVVGVILAAVEDVQAISYPAKDAVEMAYALQAHSARGEPVVADVPYIAGLAGRNVPPQLIDTSLVRIQTGNLTAAQVETVLTRSNIHAVLFASGRFDAMPGLRAWVQQHYAVGKDFGEGRVLYIKHP